jgi:basic amino acid/polyamine antiporter, APA family
MNEPNIAAETGLSRRLGLWATTLSGVGLILGAGIYVLVGVAAGEAGNALWLSFLIAALVAALTGSSYARLARLRPKDAPEFQYLGMAFGRTPAFLAGWLMLWATVISSAAIALGFGAYLEHLAGLPSLAGAAGLIALASLVVFLGVGKSLKLSGIFTVAAAAGLILIIGIGIPSFGKNNLLEMSNGLSGVVGAAPLVFFAFLGFESMVNLSEEMNNPEHDLPVSILLVLGISTILYLLVSVSAVSVLGWQELSRASAPLAAVASQLLGVKADLLLTLIALFSTANTVLLLLFTSSRAMWAMSCAQALPMTFCVIGTNRRTPWFTIIIVGIVAGVFVLLRRIEDVAEYTNFATLLVFAGVNASAMVIFARRKSAGHPGHLLADIALPALGALASLWLAVSIGWRAALFGGILLASGGLLQMMMNHLRARGPKPTNRT